MKSIIILNVQYYYLCMFIIISLFPHKSLCDDPKYDACVPKICGNVTIKFPFIIEGVQESYCGYPGLKLTCNNNEYPVLEIKSDEYRVKDIAYGTSSIRVANVALWPLETSNSKCDLPQIRNLTLQGDQLVHSNNLSVTLLTNCSGYPPSQLYKYMVGCDGGNVSNAGLVMSPDDANFSDGFRTCNVVTVVPVLETGYVNGSGGYYDYYVDMLREGFDLNWKASGCTGCEASGGRCGFELESFAFKCYCTDRPHSRTCKPTTTRVNGTVYEGVLESGGCNFYFPNSSFVSFTVHKKLTLLKCLNASKLHHNYANGQHSIPNDSLRNCSVIHRQIKHYENESILPCYEASCRTAKGTDAAGEGSMKLILATAIPGAVLVFVLVLIIIIWKRKKWSKLSTYVIPRRTFSDVEEGSSYYGMPVFSYKELEEATHNFDPSKELGDGGFGTVYHGILRDGREVAVKRLYENNYKGVEQFMNEIHILTRLHHRNLVQLYGSTSHRSPKLLLVYEYIPNGTVADHLHGDKAQTKPLTWPVRMNIAIETASALSYLHESDIIHRDVKTNNILLDNHFCVKVADFGLSRLFPNDVSHVSTAPQGTPGYVDPEYHQCYQLSNKSDVYSFGVVLIELISSLPAVDISRQRNEINLANLAVDRIQRCALDELIDPKLGHNSDANIERMTTSVAELAFQCLQLDRDLRPTMDEVLNCLKQIQGVDLWRSGMQHPSPESENIILLKEKLEESPVGVADKWMSSRSTTPNTSKNG